MESRGIKISNSCRAAARHTKHGCCRAGTAWWQFSLDSLAFELWKMAQLSVLCTLFFLTTAFFFRSDDFVSTMQQETSVTARGGGIQNNEHRIDADDASRDDNTYLTSYSAELHPDTIEHIGTSPILDVPLACADHKRIRTLFAICSQPKSRSERNVIRQTFGGGDVSSYLQAKTLFFMGKAKSRTEHSEVIAEYEVHKDLIVFDYDNSYANVTLKYLAILHWVNSKCANAEWIFKVDEDTLVNPFEIATILDEFEFLTEENSTESNSRSESVSVNKAVSHDILCEQSETYVCRPADGRCPARYAETYEDWPDDEYPPYCRGLLVGHHRQIVAGLLRADRDYYDAGLRRSRLDDVHVTGFLARNLNLRFHDFSDRVISFPEEEDLQEILIGSIIAMERIEANLPKGTTMRLWDYIIRNN